MKHQLKFWIKKLRRIRRKVAIDPSKLKHFRKDIKKFIFFVSTIQAVHCTYELLKIVLKELNLLIGIL
jgi:Fe-S oxidoreductase